MSTRGIVTLCIVLGLIVILTITFGLPPYFVWQQGLSGQAKLREAESSRQIAIQEALAKKESAKLLAEAEVERAKGVAAANKIIGEGLKDNHEYLIYLWIQELANSGHVIYVPTEANLPILEAGKFTNIIRPAK